MMFCFSLDLFLKYCLIYLVWIITMKGSILSCVEISVGIYVLNTVTGFFRSRTITMMYSGLLSSWSTYCFRFLLKLLYLSLASLCLYVVPKTTSKSYTSPLKFLIDYLYAGRLNHLTRPSCPWWPLLTPWMPWHRNPLIVLDLIASWAQTVVALPSPPQLTAFVVAAFVSGVIFF